MKVLLKRINLKRSLKLVQNYRMERSPVNLALSLILLCPASFALDIKKFSYKDDFPKAIDLQERSSSKGLGELSRLKWYQVKSDFKNCVSLTEKNKSNKSLGVWIAEAHLSCLNSLSKRRSSWKAGQFLDSFKILEENKRALLNSPYPDHRNRLLDLYLDLAQLALHKAKNRFEDFVDRNKDLVDYMDEKQRAHYYELMGEYAWLNKNNQIAVANFIRSYRFNEKKSVLNRLKLLQASGVLKVGKYNLEFNSSDGEEKLWNQFSQAVKKGQSYNVARYGVEYLNDYPGSNRIERVRKKVDRFYKRLLYRRGSKYESAKKDFENQLKKAPPASLMFWATSAYERGYQVSSFNLSDAAAEKWDGSPLAAEAMMMAGRSAYYIGKTSTAKSYFKDLGEKYSGTESSFEALYFLGLLHFREKEYKSVISVYDRFLLHEGSDKYELQVRYWLWRSLKEVGSKRAKDIAASIFKTFPLTYYGLVVRMEEKKGLQNLLSETKEEFYSEYWWPENSKKRWKRIEKLISFGWVDEAETEIDFLPDPQTAGGFLIRAKLWRSALRENRAIADYAAAIDINLDYISRDYLKESFPQHFEKEVVAAEKEFKISRNLIWAIIRQESAFMKRAISPSNAYGLMQMLSPTAKETARWLRVKKFKTIPHIFDAKTNIRFGTHFISRMIGKYKGIIPLAIASYNVGPGNLDRWLNQREGISSWEKIGTSPDDDVWMDELPWAETSFYVKAVLRNYLLYKVIHEKSDQLSQPPWKEALTSS